MFFATPSDLWNSPNRFRPMSASRTMSSDYQSPTASTDRATGQLSFAKLVRFMAASVNPPFGCNTQPRALYTRPVANCNQLFLRH